MKRAQESDRFELTGVAERLAPYELSRFEPPSAPEKFDSDLVDRAFTLLKVMPLNQHRETVANLISPNDPPRGRRAVDALIESALVTEDEHGHLHKNV